MTKLTEETKKKAEKLKIKRFDKNRDFVFPLYGRVNITVEEIRNFLLPFKNDEVIVFEHDCSINYGYIGSDSSPSLAQLDYADLSIRKTEPLSEEEVLQLIAEAEKKKAKNLVANKKRQETVEKNKEKRIKQLEEELEKLKGK